MKTTQLLILLLLNACGSAIHSFCFAPDVSAKDREWIEHAMAKANQGFGCEALRVDDNSANYIYVAQNQKEYELLGKGNGGSFDSGDTGNIYLSPYSTEEAMTKLFLHEAGHALGYYDHSPTPGDVMFWQWTGPELSDEIFDRYIAQIRAHGDPCGPF